MTDHCLILPYSVLFEAILNSLKTNIFAKFKFFFFVCYKLVLNNTELTFMEKKKLQFFKKKSFIEWPL